MAVLRRLTALVTMLVMLLLVFTESGFACSRESMAAMAGMRMAAAATEGEPATASMTGMPDMPGMPGMPAANSAGAQRPSDQHGAPERPPCRFPWAPDGCRDMAPCAPAALAVASTAPLPDASAPEARVVARVTAPASVDRPPELPPPRA